MFSTTGKVFPRTPESSVEVPDLSLNASVSCCCASCETSRWWHKCLDTCHPSGDPNFQVLGFGLAVEAFGNELVGRFSIFLPFKYNEHKYIIIK